MDEMFSVDKVKNDIAEEHAAADKHEKHLEVVVQKALCGYWKALHDLGVDPEYQSPDAGGLYSFGYSFPGSDWGAEYLASSSGHCYLIASKKSFWGEYKKIIGERIVNYSIFSDDITASLNYQFELRARKILEQR